MKKILFVLAISFSLFQSCVIEAPYGDRGESFLKLNWVDDEPSFVTTNGAIPDNFRWNTYYKTYEGLYTVNYEYEYYNNFTKVVYPYEIEIEIFEMDAEPNGYDGDDVYFDLVLFPDNYIEFSHEIVYKSEKTKPADVTVKTKIDEKVIIKNNKKLQCTYYQLPSYSK